MVREELVGHARVFAALPEEICKRLDIRSPISEDEVVATAQRLEEVIGYWLESRVGVLIITAVEIPPKLQPQFPTVRVGHDPPNRRAVAWSEELGRKLDVAERCTERDTRHSAAKHELKSIHQALKLTAALGSYECVQLVHHDAIKVGKDGREARSVEHEERFERLRGDEHDAARTFEDASFAAGGNVAVPRRYL
jgi:hypothetical protein